MLYNTYMVSTSTSLYDKFTPAFVYWQITTDGEKIPAFLRLSGYLNDGESNYVAILYEHGKPFYVPEEESIDPRQVACGSNKDNVKCYFEGNALGKGDYENVFVPSLLNKIIIDFSTA